MTFGDFEVSGPQSPYIYALFRKAWKYVDVEHANAVAAGQLRIGTLSSYAALENGRSDTLDGALEIKVDRFVPNRQMSPAMKRMGFGGMEILGEDSEISNLTRTERIAPINAFCMSMIDTAFEHRDRRPQALFEVDVMNLRLSLGRHYRDQFMRIGVGRVRYYPRSIDAFQWADEVPNPLVKGLEFAGERELRLLMVPLGDRAEVFFTPPSPDVGACFRRLS